MRRYRLLTATRVAENTSIKITNIDGGAVNIDFPIAEGLYYLSGDATATDLIPLVAASHGGRSVGISLANDRISLFAAGVGAAGRRIDISFDSTARYLWDAFRLPPGNLAAYRHSFVFGAAAPLTATRMYLGGFSPQNNYLHADLEKYRPLAEQFVPDAGNPQTLWVATRKEYEFRVRASGYPRPEAGGYTEYHELTSWYQQASSGLPTRIYPDTTITAAHSATQRFGYSSMIVIPEDMEPEPESDGWYKNWQFSFRGIEYEE